MRGEVTGTWAAVVVLDGDPIKHDRLTTGDLFESVLAIHHMDVHHLGIDMPCCFKHNLATCRRIRPLQDVCFSTASAVASPRIKHNVAKNTKNKHNLAMNCLPSRPFQQCEAGGLYITLGFPPLVLETTH
jgi:hypothetical protein